MTKCYICGDDRENSLEEHHIVPRRYGGSDRDRNLITVCASCHSAIEKIYDDSFYERLGVSKPTDGGIELQEIEGAAQIEDGDDLYIDEWNCFVKADVSSRGPRYVGLQIIGGTHQTKLSRINTWPYDAESSFDTLEYYYDEPIEELGISKAKISGNRVDLIERFIEEEQS